MPPKAAKSSKKEKIKTENVKAKYPPLQINFKITEIENFNLTYYPEYNIDFSHKDIQIELVEEIPVIPIDGTGDTIKSSNIDGTGGGDTIKISNEYPKPNKHIISNLYNEYYFMFDRNTIDDINKFCDSPLFVGIYGIEEIPIENPSDNVATVEQKPSAHKTSKKGKGNIEVPTLVIEKNKKLLAYNFIDMLHWLRKTPLNITEHIFLYLDPSDSLIPTPSIQMHIESKRRLLLQEYEFPNLCRITLESIFNINKCTKEEDNISAHTKLSNKSSKLTKKKPATESSIIIENPSQIESRLHVAEKFTVQFSFIKYNENSEQIKEEFCTFKNGHYCPLPLQIDETTYKKWDSIPNVYGPGTWTTITTNHPFNLELFQEDTYLNLSEYDENSEIYTFNSMHRYLMPTAVCKNLEQLINQEIYQLMIEVKYDDNEEVQLIGYVDLSPLLYPNVYSGRFLVILENYVADTKKIIPDKKSKQDKKFKPTPSTDSWQKTEKSINESIFLIFKIRFHTPLTVISKIGIEPETFVISEPPVHEPPKPTLTEIANNTLINFENEVLTIVKQLPKYLTGEIINDEIICKDRSCKECLLAMQSNLVDNISKLVSSIYSVQYPTQTNSEFRNLMTLVFNELTVKIEKIINDYYLGINNSARIIDDREQKNLQIFSHWESQKFSEFIGQSWMSKRPADILSTEDLLDVIMINLHAYDFVEVEKRLAELLKRNHAYYYGLLIKLYLIYIKSETKEFIVEILKVIEMHPMNLELWSILYAIFDNVNYRAGSKYAKMKYTMMKRDLPVFWDIVFIFFPERRDVSQRKPLFDCVYTFLTLGLFKFADLIYLKCKTKFEPNTSLRLNYICKCCLRDYKALKVELQATPDTPDNYLQKKLFWGHYYFATNNRKLAKINYELFFHTDHKQMLYYDHVAFLRCGFMEILEKNYENAETYFVVCCRETNSSIAWYGLGITLYRSNKFLKARQCFSKVTQCKWIKLLETWLYLAMISVKLKEFDLAKKFMELAKTSADTTQQARLDDAVWDEAVALLKENYINV